MRSTGLIGALLIACGGCAYYNGVYNARAAERRGDRLARAGRAAEAEGFYATAAVKAETVLVRHGKSRRWADDALYLAGRGWALSGQCARAEPRLEAYLALSGQAAEQTNRAKLALGICLVKRQQFQSARSILATLVETADRVVANDAALWAARASIQLGQNDSAQVYLRRVGTAAAEWELASAFLDRGRHEAAESLLVLRANTGDVRPELFDALTSLWSAGRRDAVERIGRAYDSVRLSSANRARLHFFIGDLWMQAGADSIATTHLAATQRLVRDSVMGREAAARIALMSLRDLATLVDVENRIAAAVERASGTKLLQRLNDNLFLIRILENRTDFTGSTMFLAAEVARDSLRARALAHNYFMRSIAAAPRSPVAAKALIAAAAVRPDSAESYIARLRAEYPSSSYTALVTGGDSVTTGRLGLADDLLRQVWELSVRQFNDSLRVLRPPPGASSGAPAAVSDRQGRERSSVPPPPRQPPG